MALHVEQFLDQLSPVIDDLMFPEHTTLYITAIKDWQYKEGKINWWDDVNGFEMLCIKKVAMQECMVKVVVQN